MLIYLLTSSFTNLLLQVYEKSLGISLRSLVYKLVLSILTYLFTYLILLSDRHHSTTAVLFHGMYHGTELLVPPNGPTLLPTRQLLLIVSLFHVTDILG